MNLNFLGKIKKSMGPALLNLVVFAFGLLLISESTLQIASYFAKKQVESNSNPKQGQFIILAVGESTTYIGEENSYPSLLEKELNSKFNLNAKLINAGVPGTDSLHILENLPTLIDKHQPQILLFMVGINDGRKIFPSFISKAWQMDLWNSLSNLRTLRFIQNWILLNEQEQNLVFPSETSYWLQELGTYRNQQSCSTDLDCQVAEFLKDYQQDMTEKWRHKIPFFMTQLTKLPARLADFFRLRSGFDNFTDSKFEKSTLKNIFEICSRGCADSEKIIAVKIVKYRKWQADFQSELQQLSRQGKISPLLQFNLEHLDIGDDSIKIYQNPQRMYFNPMTRMNIQSMAKYAVSKNIRSYFIQYPTLPPEPLVEALAEFQVGIISNQNNFQTALEKEKYEDIFTDRFAGNFGHATKYGNQILVEAIIQKFKADNIIP